MSRISYMQNKIVDLRTAVYRINSWKMKNHTIVFTNGCFDILHVGHITYLAKAAQLGSKLVVAVNDDKSVKTLNKGENRPINHEKERMQVLASLAFVDLVLLFSDHTPFNTIKTLMPDILVKGGDYDPFITDKNNKKYIVGSDLIINNGGRVEVIDLEEGFSTTSIIEKIRK